MKKNIINIFNSCKSFCIFIMNQIKRPINFIFAKCKKTYERLLKWLNPGIQKCKKTLMRVKKWMQPGITKCKSVITKVIVFLTPLILVLRKIFAKIFIFIGNKIKKCFSVIAEILKKFKPVLFVFNLILTLYITIVAMLVNAGKPLPSLNIIIVSAILLFCIIYIILKLFFLECDIGISRNIERKMLSWKSFYVFLSVSVVVFAVFIINFLANYPGGISTDNVDQWMQVQSGEYNNWHPAIHSMMIWLITRIVDNYAFVLRVQIFLFSLMCGYLAATLVSWGIKVRWILVFLFVLISPRTTYGIMLYAWKDNALTILLLCLTAYMINIVLSDGLWLKKWYNILGFSIIFALASMVRHNGIFFTAPLLLFIFLFIRKAKLFTLITVAASLLVVYGITNWLYPKANVEYPEEQTYVESVGLPMTILGGVLVNKPEALDDETKTFLYNIASDQQWRRNFRTGNFNSVKFLYPRHKEAIMEIPPKQLLEMTWQAVKNAPDESLNEFIALTRFVWDPFDWNNNVIIWNNETARGILYSRAEIDAIQPIKETYIQRNKILKEVTDLITPNHILTSIGLNMLLLLLAGFYSLNRNHGYKALFLFAPSIAYNIGTMLLLCGPDWRFFHFNTVITLPLIIVLLTKNINSIEENENTGDNSINANVTDDIIQIENNLGEENEQ